MSQFAGLPDVSVNPEYTKETYLIYAPQFENFVGGEKGNVLFEKYLAICNEKVRQSVFLEDWEVAMALAISHYISLTNVDREQSFGSGDLAKSSGIDGVDTTKEEIAQDYSKTTVESDVAKFWYQTRYGQRYFNLLQTKTRTFFGITV